MASRMISTAIRPAASFAVSRQAVAAQRSFSGSTMALKHKESHGTLLVSPPTHKYNPYYQHQLLRLLTNPAPIQTGEDHDPEKHKQDLLSKHKSGKGHWKPELASDSEEAVKADRASGQQNEDIASLQNRTKSTAEETSKTGTSMRDGL
ncbi:hypothetical protein CHU98_g921 [Xylaria longipes]|nr:hypothetical protein CHU98_g921 [Xylaria longipes]